MVRCDRAPAERLEDADTTRSFLEHGREITGLVLDVPHDEVIRAFEPAAQQQHGNRGGNRQEAEPDVQLQEQREDREHFHDDDQEEDRAERRETTDQRDVGVRT